MKTKKSNIPKMASGLSPESKHWWRRVMRRIDKSILIPADCFALMLLSDALADYHKLKLGIDCK